MFQLKTCIVYIIRLSDTATRTGIEFGI